MHIKSNIEHNIVQIATLAVCPLLIVTNNLSQGAFYILATCVCYFVSAMACKIFGKNFGNNLKVFITAILSTFILTVLNYIVSNHKILDLETPEQSYFAILATICLCLDTYFVDKKSEQKMYLFKVLYDCALFSMILLFVSFFTELLGYGTIFNLKLTDKFTGIEFFTDIAFKFILLAAINFVLDKLYREKQAKKNEKKMGIEKYVRRIRDEKFFQYEDLRRKQLLTSKVIIKNVNEEKAQEIEQKINENDTLETEEDKKKLEEEEEKKEKEEAKKKTSSKSSKKSEDNKTNFKNSKEQKAKEKKKKKAPKKKEEKFKGSVKKAKVERVFTKTETEDDE